VLVAPSAPGGAPSRPTEAPPDAEDAERVAPLLAAELAATDGELVPSTVSMCSTSAASSLKNEHFRGEHHSVLQRQQHAKRDRDKTLTALPLGHAALPHGVL